MSDEQPATSARSSNASRVLRIVHRERAASRAQLTATTGLNRSTIGGLVAELVSLGLVEERSPDLTRRVGRPSPVVVASPHVVAIAANPEVDALELAAIALDQTIRAKARIELDQLLTPEATATRIAGLIERWRSDELASARITSVGIAVPGLVRASDGLVRNAPHLGWRNAPLRDLMIAATGLPTVVANDASLGAAAEQLFGAARGVSDAIYLNGGASGIGGGVIISGRLVTGAGGYAGEFGQNRPGIGDPTDQRAENGTLEDEVSRSRLLSVLRLSRADDAHLRAALRSLDDARVRAEVERQTRILATALANAVNVLNPSVIVLGGFLAILRELAPTELAEDVAAKAMAENAEGLDIRGASLADDRLLIGAAEAAFERLLADPHVV